MTGVHDVAERGFGSTAAQYERGRPSYPAPVRELLERELGVGPGSTVLDVGAGTGKFTRLLVATGARVLALEPVAGMREQLAAAVPDVELVGGTAEAMDLPDASVDVVTAATAFHWFDGERAVAEAYRVLRRGGAFAVVWNVRDESVDWVVAIRELIAEAVETAATEAELAKARELDGKDWRAAFDGSGLFSLAGRADFEHVHEAEVATHVERFESVSFVGALPADARRRLSAAIAELLRTHPATRGSELVALPYRTEVYWYRALPAAAHVIPER